MHSESCKEELTKSYQLAQNLQVTNLAPNLSMMWQRKICVFSVSNNS